MNNLYELNSAYLSLLQEVRGYAEEHNGEISNELSIRLDAVELARDVKIENTLGYWKNENAIADTIAREIVALEKRQQTHQNNAAWCKQYLAGIVRPKEKMEFGCGKISWRESTSAEVQDFSKLPAEFVRIIPETREPDKVAIKDALKSGKEVTGAVLVVKQNIQLK